MLTVNGGALWGVLFLSGLDAFVAPVCLKVAVGDDAPKTSARSRYSALGLLMLSAVSFVFGGRSHNFVCVRRTCLASQSAPPPRV